MKAFGIFVSIFVLIGFSGRCGATVYNSDGTAASVQSIHDDQAQDGDTITLPAGTFTWNVHVGFTKAVNVTGAGTNQTFIYDNVPKTGGSESVLWSFNVAAGKMIRVHDFTIHGQAQDTENYNAGTLNVAGGSHAVRVDHINFVQPGTGCMIFDGDIWGVVDHCYFEGAFKQGVQIHHGGWNGGPTIWGDASYEDPLHLGTERALYIEDCTFNGELEGGAIDGTYGGRVVFRYNSITDTNVGFHGTEGFRGRGMRSFEIYNNTFVCPDRIIFTGLYIRSGTGVIFNNSFSGGGGETGFQDMVLATVYRDFLCGGQTFSVPWGMATGVNPWDGNTQSNGYPAIDQVGHGTCLDQIRGDTPINQRTGTQAWPRNQLEPVYEWNNSWTPVPQNPGEKVGFQCDIVQRGRDVLPDTPMPGYTPYTYPHPLVTGGGTPTPTPTPTATATPTATDTPTGTPTQTPTPCPGRCSPTPRPSPPPAPRP